MASEIPTRSGVPAPEALTESERDARIEQLLLGGLDEYFAGQYEQAINLWTRVLFLDRHHDRARAYIERARRAQAELQRESEAILQQGIQAFHEGDVASARRLLTDAVRRGASPEVAQGLLDRIDRLRVGRRAPRFRRRVPASPPSATDPGEAAAASGTRGRFWTAALLLVAAVGVLVVGMLGFTLPQRFTRGLLPENDAGVVPATVPIAPLSLPSAFASESFLARSRVLFRTGRLRDALAELDRIPLGDSLRPDADRLRASIQSELLVLAAAEREPPPADAAEGEVGAERPPE